jgi:hypothetical protein
MRKSEQINELASALAKAQRVITFASKDAKNPYYNSKYADLACVWDAIREPLSSNGLSVSQSPEHCAERSAVSVTTLLMHESGQWIETSLTLQVVREKKGEGFVIAHDPQAVGSAITYARRYALAAIVGIAQDDDDGNIASGNYHGKSQANGNSPQNNTKPPQQPSKKPTAQQQSPAELSDEQRIKNLEAFLKKHNDSAKLLLIVTDTNSLEGKTTVFHQMQKWNSVDMRRTGEMIIAQHLGAAERGNYLDFLLDQRKTDRAEIEYYGLQIPKLEFTPEIMNSLLKKYCDYLEAIEEANSTKTTNSGRPAQ